MFFEMFFDTLPACADVFCPVFFDARCFVVMLFFGGAAAVAGPDDAAPLRGLAFRPMR